MSARPSAGRTLALLFASWALVVTAARAETTKITYVAGGSVYIEVGTLAGVQPGDTLRVLRDSTQVALVRVAFVSTKRAACDTLWTRTALAIGDDVRWTAHAAAPAVRPVGSPAAGATAAGATTRPARAATRLHGLLGANWVSVSAGASQFRQPGINLRLDDAGEGGGHADFVLDMRTRRTTRSFTGLPLRTEQLARVYRATVRLRTLDAHRSLTLGRQTSPTLAAISLFDGALLQTGTDRRRLGVFSGTQPDPLRYRLSADIVETGAFVEWHQPPRTPQQWSLALGGVTSQQHGQSNRDFLFAQANWFTHPVSGSVAQEVDVNRGWKRRLGEAALSPTSTFATVRVQPAPWLGVNTGYDNRRNVRLYRDHLTPETQFDDAYRQGAWGGGDVSLLRHVRLSADLHSTAGADRAHSWSWNVEGYRFTARNLAVHARVSQYDGSTVTSRLSSGGLGFEPFPLSHVELSGGVRRSLVLATATGDSERWQEASLDLTLGRRWYANGSWERDYGGGNGNTRQLQGALNWRF